MPAGPLSLLGDALSQGSRDYLNISREQQLHDRNRSEQLTDESRRREERVGDVRESRAYEDTVYKQRRFDHVIDQLITDGYLARGDADKPDAVDAALKSHGAEYERNVLELAAYRASLPKIIEAVGGSADAEKIMTLKPTEIEKAREIMKNLYGALGQRAKSDRDRGEANARNGAAALASHNAIAAGIQSKHGEIEEAMNRLMRGELDPTEINAARAAALGRRPDLAKEVLSPSQKAELAAEIEKAKNGIANQKMWSLGKAKDELNNQSRVIAQAGDNIASNLRAGAYAYMTAEKPAGASPVSAAPTPTAASPNPDAQSFIAVLKGEAKPATMARPAVPAGAAPAAFGDPVLARGAEIQSKRSYESKASDFSDAQAELDSINKQIAALQAGKQVGGMGQTIIPADRDTPSGLVDPDDLALHQANTLKTLLERQAAARARVEARRSAAFHLGLSQ